MADRQRVAGELGEIGNEAEPPIASRAINREIPAVKSEDSVDGFAISQLNKRGIGELRLHGFIFLHEIADGPGLQTR